ncbi:MAG: MBL fold metallo-hydrolase [Haloarculaceae archaeon]
MGTGDVHHVAAGECRDLYCVDPGTYGVAEQAAVYVIDDDRPAIVETGTGANHERILDALPEIGLSPEDVEVLALTHVHLDHAGGAGFLAEACPNATVVVHERGAAHLADPATLVAGTKQVVGESGWQFYAEPEPVPEERIREITDGDAIDLGEHRLVAHHAPGHATHQVVLDDPVDDAVFTADAAGCYYPWADAPHPLSPPPSFDLQQCLDDVGLLRELDRSTLLVSHFGPHSGGKPLDEYESVLKAWIARVSAARRDSESDRAAFKALLDEHEPPAHWSEDLAFGEFKMNVSGAMAYLDARAEEPTSADATRSA